MGSDSEIYANRPDRPEKSEESVSALEFSNGHTVNSFTYEPPGRNNGDTIEATQNNTVPDSKPHNANDDDEEEDEKSSLSFFETIFKFLVKTTPFAQSVKMILWSLLLAAISAIGFKFLGPKFALFSVENIPSHVLCVAFVLGGYGIVLAVLHSAVIFAHRQSSFYQSDLLHWVTEFERYIAAASWISVLLVIFANLKNPIVMTSESVYTLYGFFKIFVLADNEPKVHIHIACVALVVVVCSAVKLHFMHKLAIQFNFSNYCDRVEESLFIERILQLLNRARQSYRFRKKWKMFLTDSSNAGSKGGKKQTMTIQRSEFIDVTKVSNERNEVQFDLKEFSTGTPTKPAQSPGSPQFVEISSTPMKPTSPSYYSQPTSATTANTTTGPSNSTSTTNVSNSEKKKQFDEFARLANRTATLFDSLSGVDIRVEIHREAKRLASQLFKWLHHQQRGNITAAELEPFIENSDDLNRFVTILKRSQKVPAHLQSTTVSFSEGDLRRAIDACLQERNGLAKSMETIEMALDKIDGILNFLLVILAVTLLSHLFINASIISSISSIYVATSFFFKDVAKSTFESIIFLLIIHPFDIGDRVFIKLDTTDNKAGGDCTDNLLVVEMNLMSTVFERWDGVKIHAPNYVLASKPIYNIRRSGPTTDVLKMSFAHSTRIDQLESLRIQLHAFLRQNRQDFTEFHRINVDALENCNKMNVTILVQHATNWQDLELQMGRRTKILTWLKTTIEELEITYLPPVQRVQIMQKSTVESPFDQMIV